MKKLIAGALTAAMVLGTVTPVAVFADEKQDLTLGLMLSDNTNQFFSTLEDAFKKAAEDAGYEVISLSSGNDAAKDVTNMEDLLTQNPDVIVYNPVDSDAAGDAGAMANDAGIPVVTVDRAANSGDIVCHIASDNVYGGEIAAQYIVDQLPDGGQVVEIQGQAGASATNERGEGFHNIMDDNDKFEVVVSQTGNWSSSEAMSVMENALTANPDIKAVFCHNDQMALGAIEACQQADRDDIVIVGFDADADNLDAIKAGTQAATVRQLPALMGETAVEVCGKIAAGEEVEASIGTEVELVTADNVDADATAEEEATTEEDATAEEETETTDAE